MPAEPSGKGSRRPVQIGKYEVLAHIATGGMGAVYRARDVDLDREVALKVLPPELAVKPGMLERFQREAKSAARLRHENIVTIYEFAEANGTYFLALEFVDGIDLHDFIGRRGKLKPDMARQILIQAARALAHAHEKGIVHRDIKPSNLLITQKDGQLLVKLTDLGLARVTSDDEFRITRDGSTVGTIDYMSPEQARSSAAADIRSDIYSLGCTFYHMLAGTCPFPEGSLTERIYKHIEAEPPDVRRLNPEVPDKLAAILSRMLQKKPQDRYQTPQELLRDLEDPAALAARSEPSLAAAETAVGIPQAPSSTARLRAQAARPAEPVRAGKPVTPPPKPSSGARKRFRGEDDDEEESQEPAVATGLPSWWPLAACVGALVILLLVALFSLGSSSRPSVQEQPEPPPRKGDLTPFGTRRSVDRRPDDRPQPGALKPTAERANEADRERLRAEFEGPLRQFPEPPADAVVLRVSRSALASSGVFRSLAEACAAAPAGRHTIIEIHANGPLFEPSLPLLAGRSLTLRAGLGFRPLIAWETAGGASERLLALANGNLTLENLDLVLKWPEGAAPTQPAAFFAVTDGSLAARRCTFSVAGKHPHGIQIARLQGQANSAGCRLSQCYVRGVNLTAVAIRDVGADVLLDNSLIVTSGPQPLLDVRAREDARCALRMVRATLIADRNFLQIASAARAKGSPAVKSFCWDSVLARPGPEVQGDLIQVLGEAEIGRLDWRALNAVYAGWQNLLVSAARNVSAAELDTWHHLWTEVSDRVLAQPWPASVSSELEETAASAFDFCKAPASFAAIAGQGPVGCDLAALPAGRTGWLSLTYERFVMAPLSLPEGEAVPEIPRLNDGRYHGEDVKLDGRLDLGQLLRVRLQNAAPGPRIVLRVFGSGTHLTSPIQLRGADLVLYFYPPRGKARPLTLAPNPRTSVGQPALIDVEGGILEMTGAHLVCDNSAMTAMPNSAIRVQGGALRLFGCRLQGPLTHLPPEYQGLIEFHGSGNADPGQACACVLNQCVLVSGRGLLSVRGAGARLRLRHCALLALDDGLLLDPASAAGPHLNVQCSLEHNTIAARRGAIVLKDTPKLLTVAEPILLQADDNLFLNPFAGDAPPSALLVHEGNALARGVMVWQGKGNGYDAKRLCAYAIASGAAMAERQTHEAWVRLWGKAGEDHARLLEWPATASWTVTPDHPQLDRLRLPSQMGAFIGADLVRLGIVKRR